MKVVFFLSLYKVFKIVVIYGGENCCLFDECFILLIILVWVDNFFYCFDMIFFIDCVWDIWNNCF